MEQAWLHHSVAGTPVSAACPSTPSAATAATAALAAATLATATLTTAALAAAALAAALAATLAATALSAGRRLVLEHVRRFRDVHARVRAPRARLRGPHCARDRDGGAGHALRVRDARDPGQRPGGHRHLVAVQQQSLHVRRVRQVPAVQPEHAPVRLERA